jgi:hypothetical protein
MSKTRRQQTGKITVRREDDGAEFELLVISTFHEVQDEHGRREVEDRLKDVASSNGREVYTTDEEQFFFGGEPNRPMKIVSKP